MQIHCFPSRKGGPSTARHAYHKPENAIPSRVCVQKSAARNPRRDSVRLVMLVQQSACSSRLQSCRLPRGPLMPCRDRLVCRQFGHDSRRGNGSLDLECEGRHRVEHQPGRRHGDGQERHGEAVRYHDLHVDPPPMPPARRTANVTVTHAAASAGDKIFRGGLRDNSDRPVHQIEMGT